MDDSALRVNGRFERFLSRQDRAWHDHGWNPARSVVSSALLALVVASPAAAQRVVPEVLIEGRFNGAEGLAFSAEGRLYLAANRAVWEVSPDGSTRRVAGFTSNLGLHPIGPRDILKADFGPLVRPQAGPNSDGVIYRFTPEGDTTRIASGIGDPNAIAILPDGTVLVSDDFTHDIYQVGRDGRVSVFTDAIPFPNGLALAPDGSALYVAQIFSRAPDGPPPVRFDTFSDQVWRLPLRDGRPAGPPEVIFRTGGETGPDGLTFGPDGCLWLSAARAGQLWRIDPATGRGLMLADSIPGLASLAFGQGRFDPRSLYAAQIRGGRLLRFRIPEGLPPCGPAAAPARESLARQAVRLDTLARGLGQPMAMAFISPDTALVSSHAGRWHRLALATGEFTPVTGGPAVVNRLEAGAYDIALDPGFGSNRWVYLAVTVGTHQRNTLAVVRARLDGHHFTDTTTILTAAAWDSSHSHYGGQLEFAGEHLFVTVGDRRLERERAQDLGSHRGKVLRVTRDGRAPADNPFVGRPAALPEIWSYGHRNPQGLAVDDTGTPWVSEHGPRHGDELNRIVRGRDYGWPRVTWGWEYEGGAVGAGLPVDSATPAPEWVWSPGIAPSGLLIYRSALLPGWRGSFFVGGMHTARRNLNRLVWDGQRVVLEERLYPMQLGRVRFAAEAPDGRIYLGNDDGLILRLSPTGGTNLPETSGARGLRGDAAAIAEAEAMVETMGGATIWAPLKSIHLVHEWYPWNRADAYIENETLDLTGPRSLADRRSEITHSARAYSPEGRRWSHTNGEFAYGSGESLAEDLARAPFNFFRLVRAVAVGDPYYAVRFGPGDIPGTRRLEFSGPDGVVGGWIILNARKEPIVKATPAYRYTLGPLKRFGNLRVPAWGVYDNGVTRYEMISLTGDRVPPDTSVFLPPPEFRRPPGSE